MSDYINESADIFNEDEKTKPLIFISILKWFCIGIIILIIGILAVRMFIHRDSKITNKVIMTEEFLEEHQKIPEGLEVRKYGMPSPWINVVEKAPWLFEDYENPPGRIMEFDSLYHIPKTNQLQLSIKYNEDIIPEGVEGFPLKFRLVDEKGNTYEKYSKETDSIAYFQHIRVCFEDIEIETGEFDENGIPKRHSYNLEIDVKLKDGSYKKMCDYIVYNGKEQKTAVYSLVQYKVDDKK